MSGGGMDNQCFIDGSWYNDEYTDKWYHKQYIESDEPDWAKEYKDYYINLMVAYTGAKPDWKILDMGSGVGQVMNAWERNGFHNVNGIEISQVAVNHAWSMGIDKIICGSVQKMPFKDNCFDLVTSFALLEHIDESILRDTLKEFRRVGTAQAHTIASEKGTDPSHINIKESKEWLQYLCDSLGETKPYLVAGLPDPLKKESPVFVCIPYEMISKPLADWMTQISEPIAEWGTAS